MIKNILEISKNFFLYRHLLMHLVGREIKGRFAGSAAGLLWNFLHPLIMFAVYLFVFIYIFKMRLSGYEGSQTAVVYLMSGLFPWLALAEGLSRSTSSLIENATLIQKSVFPTELLPAKAVIAAFSTHGLAIALLALYALLVKHNFTVILYLPLIIAFQAVFTLGVGFVFSCLSVFWRDTVQLMQLVVGFWIYITPILYPMSLLPDWAHGLMLINPVYPFVSLYQSIFLTGTIGDYTMLILVFLWTAVVYSLGAFVFSKLKYEFADWL